MKLRHFLWKGKESGGWSAVKVANDRYAYYNGVSDEYLGDGELFVNAEEFIAGTAVVRRKDGDDDIIDTTGKTVLPHDLLRGATEIRISGYGYDRGREYVKSLSVRGVGGRSVYVVRRSGEVIWQTGNRELTVSDRARGFMTARRKNGEVSLYSYEYKNVTPFFTKINVLDEKLLKVARDGKWGVYDIAAGKLAIPTVYDDLDTYGANFIVIDGSGKHVVDIANNSVYVNGETKEERKIVFDDDQKRVIEAEGGKFLVLAPPGCGKTEILSERIVRAFLMGVRLEDMACLTFTNRASWEMLKRVKEKLGEDVEKVYIGNIHKYCNLFLTDHQLVPGGARILGQDEMEAVITENCDIPYCDENEKELKDYEIREILRKIEDINNYVTQKELGQPEELLIHKDIGSDTYLRYYELVKSIITGSNVWDDDYYFVEEIKTAQNVVNYRKFKEEHALMTFSDLLIWAYKFLVEDKQRKYKRYKWIEVDEVQDLNALEIAIIDELTDKSDGYTVMYLGDEQQAIYSFAGARTEQLERLREICKGRVMTLGVNHRSPKYLLDLFNTYAMHNLGISSEILPKSEREEKHHEEDLVIFNCGDFYEQNMTVAMLAKRYHDVYPTQRTAVLVHSNKAADEISSKIDVNHYKISGMEITMAKQFKALYSLIGVCVNDNDSISWARLIYSISGISLSRAITFTSKMRDLMMTPNDLVSEETYAAAFLRSYDEEEIVFFDTETTGLSVVDDDIVQIAAFKVRGGRKVEGSDFSILMETDRKLPERLGDIENPLIKVYAENEHLTRKEGLTRFLDYIGDDAVLGHNVDYDYHILKYNVERTLEGRSIDNMRRWDSLRLTRLVEPQLRSYKLKDLLQTLGLEGENSHLADDDVAATKSVVDYCAGKIRGVVERQSRFMSSGQATTIKSRLEIIKPLIDDVMSRLYSRAESETSMADVMRKANEWIVNNKTIIHEKRIEKIQEKISLIIKYAEKEWTDAKGTHTLIDTLNDRLRFLGTFRESDLVNSKDLISSRVFIMTVHKAKGLEFDNVILTDVYDGIYPFFANKKIMDLEEQKSKDKEDARQLYVGLSRARNRLCVVYPSYIPTPYTIHHKNLSLFMGCIQQEFAFYNDLDSLCEALR